MILQLLFTLSIQKDCEYTGLDSVELHRENIVKTSLKLIQAIVTCDN